MPKTLINENTADNYTDKGGANINSVYESRGGWVTHAATVYAQVQHSPIGGQQGQEQWSEEFVLPAGAHYLQPGLIGIRFRSFTTGVAVAISAAVFFKDEPAMQLGGSGISSPSTSVASLNFQKNDVAVATEPTADFKDAAVLTPDNLRITWTLVDDVPNTRVKITPVLAWANPSIFPNDVSTGPTASANRTKAGIYLQANSSTGGGIWSVGDNSAFTAFDASVTGDTNARITVSAGGVLQWSPGNAGFDSNLYRAAGTFLATDQNFVVGRISGGLSVGGGAISNGNGTVTLTDRVFSGGAGTGGIWVDSSTQFFGSFDATHAGVFNSGWWLKVNNGGLVTYQGTFGAEAGVGNGAAGSAAAVSITQNKICGSVLFTGQSNTANVPKGFVVTNSTVTANDTVIVNMNNQTTAAGTFVLGCIVTGGSFTITCLSNTANAGLNFGFNYQVLRGSVN